MEWTVVIHPDAEAELGRLPTREQDAIATAVAELRAEGPTLGYPHTSEVRAVHGLRELRPRRGHSRWRAFYRQIDRTLVIGAIGPEAEADPLSPFPARLRPSGYEPFPPLVSSVDRLLCR